MRIQPYETDLTDEQFALLEPLLPRRKRTGRPPADLREVLNAIFYLVRSGCQWRLLPHDFPPWSTVHTWYRRWRQDGTWDRLNDALVPQVRRQAGRDPSPRVTAVDSQSAKTTEMGGERGFDGGKKVKGRKRHIWVDSLGLLLAVLVTAANVQDGFAAGDLLHQRLWEDLPRLELVNADSQYRAESLQRAVFDLAPFRLRVVSRQEGSAGWEKLPQRWVVERTFAWLGRSRRLSKDYERLPESSEAMVKVSMIHRMTRRLRPTAMKASQRFRYERSRYAA
jgi:putative transposase